MSERHGNALGRPPLGDMVTLGIAVAAISTSAPLIAATAIELQIPLVTADKRLERIEGLNCLIIEL
jgi:predicted nucleic acid-binding protein